MQIHSDSLNPLSGDDPQIPASMLLDWYDRNARSMPWRVSPAARAKGVLPNPYHVWLSEVMLQQTQVATVNAYFAKFVRNWPQLSDLAAADTEDVMKAWAGLGYYSRARNLKQCAEAIIADHGGEFPRSSTDLKRLPGIGAYTSAAIAAIAFDEPVAVVDGNVERVVTRLLALDMPLRQAKPAIATAMRTMVPVERPGDFAQAMMDLGAILCTPRRPNCAVCPLAEPCLARKTGRQQDFPVKTAKREMPVRHGAAYVAIRDDGAVYLQKRPDKGLLGGMSEIPTTGWTARLDGETGPEHAPFAGNWEKVGSIRHTFTHFHLRLEVWKADGVRPDRASRGWWSPPGALSTEALPTVLKKAIAVAIPGIF